MQKKNTHLKENKTKRRQPRLPSFFHVHMVVKWTCRFKIYRVVIWLLSHMWPSWMNVITDRWWFMSLIWFPSFHILAASHFQNWLRPWKYPQQGCRFEPGTFSNSWKTFSDSKWWGPEGGCEDGRLSWSFPELANTLLWQWTLPWVFFRYSVLEANLKNDSSFEIAFISRDYITRHKNLIWVCFREWGEGKVWHR